MSAHIRCDGAGHICDRPFQAGTRFPHTNTRLPFPILLVRIKLTQRTPPDGLPGIRPDPTTVTEKGVS